MKPIYEIRRTKNSKTRKIHITYMTAYTLCTRSYLNAFISLFKNYTRQYNKRIKSRKLLNRRFYSSFKCIFFCISHTAVCRIRRKNAFVSVCFKCIHSLANAISSEQSAPSQYIVSLIHKYIVVQTIN